MREVPVEVIAAELGEVYGIAPWEIKQAPYDEVMPFWDLYVRKNRAIEKAVNRRRNNQPGSRRR